MIKSDLGASLLTLLISVLLMKLSLRIWYIILVGYLLAWSSR